MTWLTWKLALTAITGLILLAYLATKLNNWQEAKFIKRVEKEMRE